MSNLRSRSQSPALSLSPSSLSSLRASLLSLLHTRSPPKTLCPSEAARCLTRTQLSTFSAANWRDLMPTLRNLAFEMRDDGVLEILQGGEVRTEGMDAVKGPIRLRLRAEEGEEDREG